MDVLWTEKNRPESFEHLNYNQDVNDTLQQLVGQGDMPHLIIYGPDGSGKQTRINCLLTRLYGPSALKTTRSVYTVKNNSLSIDIPMRSSKNHIEIMPSEVAHHDVFVLIKLMKETATNAFCSDSKNHFLTFVINDAENLTLKAQAALRRTMEKYSNRIRVVMVCLSTASLIPALKSRCLMIRNSAPTDEDVAVILGGIVRKEGLKKVTEQNIRDVVRKSDRNLRKAILCLQACVARNEFSGPILEEHWKTVVADKVVTEVFKNRSLDTVKQIRNVFYDLLACQIPGSLIVKELLWQVLAKLDGTGTGVRLNNKPVLSMSLKEAAVLCERQMKQGDREIIFLEGFLVKIMLAVEKHVSK